ncbi:hypothetical protein [Pedobacter frigoris]|uniref:Lipocalin-like domain-containing protein n=1 Tax=Pedobacter frigoris TaxID=2571272 RepID=A0A4U1CSM8_9SPHI|nr:hypothetical protein [Pedobacter frigoris]TKC08939.1 hypothetical protein FA047_02250 [Pedobacter frigoris]
MKTLKLTLSLFAIFLVLFAACKKEKKEAANTTVTAEDLLGYQMFWALISPAKTADLRLLYFNKEGTEVKAILDGVTFRNIKTVKMENNTFKFDFQDNGSVVYTFEFTKKDGVISLVSSKFYNVNNPAYSASIPSMLPLSKFISVKNKVFKSNDGANSHIVTFSTDTWRYSAYPNVAGTYYECGTGGWKGRIAGLDYIGLQVEQDVLLLTVQKNGENMIGFAPY